MTIKEAEKLTGVSSRNIRFYEQKGLLTPVRNRENDYREYSDGDIERLKLIRALRMVDMPLEQILEVVDGKVTLRTAATAQKEKLEEQIKKLKTVIKFCEELSEAEPENVSEVLTRMDKPENNQLFSKAWRTDYAEKAKRICKPLFAGWIPWLCGMLLFLPISFCAFFKLHGYVIVLSVLMLGIWGYLGYRLYDKERWLLNVALFLVFPVIGICLVLLNVIDGNYWYAQAGGMPTIAILAMYFRDDFCQDPIYFVWNFAAGLVCFLAGFPVRKYRNRCKARQTVRNAEKPKWRREMELTMIVIGIVVLLLAPLFVTDLSSQENYYDPTRLQDKYTNMEECLAQTEDGMVWFEITEEFVEIARFDQWERKYLRFFGENSLTIDEERINAGADLRFYDNDCVIVHVDGWKGGGDSYSFRVPDGVVEALKAYVQEHTIREATEG